MKPEDEAIEAVRFNSKNMLWGELSLNCQC